MRWLPAALLALALGVSAAPALAQTGPGDARADDSQGSREGNRKFRGGDFEGALAAYTAAYRASPTDPRLAYNLGATAHRLGRLPEALLWYRRAEALALLPAFVPGSRDPWLTDNLGLVRRELEAPRLPPRGWARWATAADALLLAGCLLAWATLAILLLAWRRPRRARARRWNGVALGLAGVGVLAFGTGWFAPLLAARPAVLLAGCGELPAGSEVWVRPAAGAGFRVEAAAGPGAGQVCPAEAVGLVEPGG